MSGFSALALIFQLKYNWKLVYMFLSSSTEVCTTLNLMSFLVATQVFFFVFFFVTVTWYVPIECCCKMFMGTISQEQPSANICKIIMNLKLQLSFLPCSDSVHPSFCRSSFFLKLCIKLKTKLEYVLQENTISVFGAGKKLYFLFYFVCFEISLFCSLSCMYRTVKTILLWKMITI